LKHALSEILLNALQANPKGGQVGVKLQTAGENGGRSLTIEVQDAEPVLVPKRPEKFPLRFIPPAMWASAWD